MRREALRSFLKVNRRLPTTVQELVSAKIVSQHIYFLSGLRHLPGRGKSLSVAQFLERTRADELGDHLRHLNIGTMLSLYLVRAIYDWVPRNTPDVPDQADVWSSAAIEVLTQKGFSKDQLELIRSDASVRLAFSRAFKITFH